MLRYTLGLLFVLLVPTTAVAGPKEAAIAVVQKFMDEFSAGGNLDNVVALFSPDALLWGTTMKDVGTDTAALKKYFSPRPADVVMTGTAQTIEAVPVTDDVVVVAGRWQVAQSKPGTDDVVFPLRYTFVVAKQGGDWKIVHLHSSLLPGFKPAASSAAPTTATSK